MKTLKYYLLMNLAVLGFISFYSCSGEYSNDKNEMYSADNRNAGNETGNAEKDAAFIKDAQEINQTEIKLGNLAAEFATLKDVRDLADMIVRDHQNASDELSDLAKEKQINISQSSSEVPSEYARLEKLSGNQFDKEFCETMVQGHRDAIDKFEKASTECADADIRSWAANMLPALRTHLENAMACKEKIEKMDKQSVNKD